MDKAGLRKIIRSKKLSDDYIKNSSRIIQEKVIASEIFQKSKSVFVYVSLPDEPATDTIIQTAFSQGKTVCVPKCISDREMLAVKISSMSDLKPGAFGIREPFAGTAVPNNFDLCIIPCVAASYDGKRLGHGAGYYDKLLGNISTYKMCLCFGENIYDRIPMSLLDICMDIVITEVN